MPEIRGDAYACDPYEVQWRAHLNTHWLLMRGGDELSQAVDDAIACRKEHGGQVRVVTSRVLYANGLGSETPALAKEDSNAG